MVAGKNYSDTFDTSLRNKTTFIYQIYNNDTVRK